ncbi:DUF6625 family protein [Endozoicomonas sp. GU-1]|uniref:DUF6625 family protein n=1 Tax=Endozoicomonas sp. GU-1 TaxID=3009078 RepID=UPI0022B31AEC|nr:DUF6625 family protein [Endozoicomonas sp. GU-1]WBA79637.1 hypothetical protein O2T12_14765 [Endozoicomonas sp. GU-1]WBA87219.1 hypothetical protein O3276_04035 [Endozoicomonas sp. GU-1]
MNSIVIVIPYFGRWPEWFSLFLESCKWNPTVNWIFYTDCEPPKGIYPNVEFYSLSFKEYKQLVSDKLGINFNPDNPYKLCDIKPALGYIHDQEIVSYHSYGFGDIDVIYGNIRDFYTDKILEYNCISSHWDRLSGHLCIFKNTEFMRNAFRKIDNWQELMEKKEHIGIDESKYSKVFLRHKKYPNWARRLYSLASSYQRNNYFKEQYSTVLFPKNWWNGSWDHPTRWYWKEGKLTNSEDGDKEFLYLHFMNFKSSTWLHKSRGEKAFWDGQTKINFVPHGSESKGFIIDETGFHQP